MKIAVNWKRMGPVYERCDGVRVHIGGRLLRSASGDITQPTLTVMLDQMRFAKIQGSHRRGMMLWANTVLPLI